MEPHIRCVWFSCRCILWETRRIILLRPQVSQQLCFDILHWTSLCLGGLSCAFLIPTPPDARSIPHSGQLKMSPLGRANVPFVRGAACYLGSRCPNGWRLEATVTTGRDTHQPGFLPLFEGFFVCLFVNFNVTSMVLYPSWFGKSLSNCI